MGTHMIIHMGTHMGIPTEILWEWGGNRNGNSPPTATLLIRTACTYIVQTSQHGRRKLMSNNHLLICDKSKFDFELGIIVASREIKMNTSTDMEPKSLVGGIYPPIPPLDPPLGGCTA